MVIKDSTFDGPNSIERSSDVKFGNGHNGMPKFKLATPVDRFAAFVIDFGIVLTPILYLAIAPFQRAAKEAAMFEDDYRLQISVALGGLVVPLIILFYQATLTWIWRGTIGKRLMGIEVLDVWGGRLSLSQSIYRAFFWLSSWLAFGIPFLSTLSNVMRRPFHDRLSDSVVISIRPQRRAASPGAQEAAMARGVYWAVGICLSMVLLYQITLTVGDWRSQASLISNLQDEGVLCAAVGEAQEEWPNENGADPQRLSVALGLFAAGYIDIECIEREINVLYKSNEMNDLLYLAKSFVHSEDTELSDLYLEKVCELDMNSDECKLSRVIEYVAVGESAKVEQEFKNVSRDAPIFISIWGLQQSITQGNFHLAQTFLSRIPNLKSIGEYLTPARAKILWGLNKIEEATGVESAAYALVSEDGKFELASFMCFERVWQNCDQMQSQSCQQFVGALDGKIELLSDLQSSMTYLRTWECANKKTQNYEDLLALPIHSSVKKMMVNRARSLADIHKLFDPRATDERVLSEFYRRFAQTLKDRESLWRVEEVWGEAKHTSGWEKLGRTLFAKFKEIKDYGGSLVVIDKLMKSGIQVPAELLESSILAAMKSGQEERARRLLGEYVKIQPMSVLARDRAPASVDNFKGDEKAEFIKNLKYLLEKDL